MIALPPTAVRRREWLACAVVLAIVATAAFWRVAAILVGQWSTNDTYSFGALVPLISGYFVWAQRHRLEGLTLAPSVWVGGLLVSACGLMLAVGRGIGVIGVQEIAMVLMVPAVVWLLCGRRYVFALWFPLLYLLLMLPIWEILTDRFHYRSQVFSAVVGERLLAAAGIAVHRNATYLELPNVTLEVASVCSGVNFLVAVIAMGVPQAYLFLKGWVPRAIVIVFAITIALFSNGLRIAIIGLLSHYELTKNIHGPGHLLQGLFVSAAGLVALHIAVMFMARRYPKPQHHGAIGVPLIVATPRWRLFAAVAVASLVVLGGANLQPRDLAAASIAPSGQHSELVSTWRLINASVPMPFVSGGPRPNTGRTFQTSAGRTVDLFTGELVYVEPVGGLGYRRVTVPTRTALSEVPIPTAKGTIFVNRISFRDGNHETDVVFWYDTNGTATSQVTTAKLATLWGLATGARPLPTLVVVTRTRIAGSDAVEPIAPLIAEIVDALQFRRTSSGLAHENDAL